MYKSIKSIHIKKERMNNMDENIELLEYIYKNAEMGVHSLTKLQEELEEKEVARVYEYTQRIWINSTDKKSD